MAYPIAGSCGWAGRSSRAAVHQRCPGRASRRGRGALLMACRAHVMTRSTALTGCSAPLHACSALLIACRGRLFRLPCRPHLLQRWPVGLSRRAPSLSRATPPLSAPFCWPVPSPCFACQANPGVVHALSADVSRSSAAVSGCPGTLSRSPAGAAADAGGCVSWLLLACTGDLRPGRGRKCHRTGPGGGARLALS